jgi:hypothetical protein
MLPPLTVPIALILYRRPEATAHTFATIAQARPSRLFLIADGPRPGEEGAVAAARAVVEAVDWPCEVTNLYAEANMGLRARVESGLHAVFAAVEQAIILEDDCVPDGSFFRYCAELLARYADDPRVMAISGDRFSPQRGRASYAFSHFPHCWGWATWRRAWALYDGPMAEWPALREGPWLRGILGGRRAAASWRATFDRVYAGKVDSWAYRWTYSCWRHGGLTALPAVNLVRNIGLGPLASNTGGEHFVTPPAGRLQFPLRHPELVAPDTQADSRIQRTHFDPTLGVRIARRLRRALRVWGPPS